MRIAIFHKSLILKVFVTEISRAIHVSETTNSEYILERNDINPKSNITFE